MVRKQGEDVKSPLQYPGGKQFALQAGLLKYLPQELDVLVSPFLGGGSVELHYASRGTKVLGYDKFPPLINFWQQLLKHPVDLGNLAEIYLGKVDKEEFYKITEKIHTEKIHLANAVYYYVMNRCSYSGKFGEYNGDGNRRFKRSNIDYIKNFKCDNLVVECLDFTESLPGTKFAYVDPPYALPKEKAKLYGVAGSLHQNFDHEKLADILFARPNWILSYNNCSFVRELYKDYQQVFPSWHYGMATTNKDTDNSKEILIFSKDYTPPQGSLDI